MQIRNLLILFVLCCLSCKNTGGNKEEEKFDKVKWATKNGKDYPYRDKMLKDLIASVKLHGLKKDEVLDLLGQPNRSDTGYLFYTISETHLGSIPVPLHTKTLVIKFTKDGIVEWRKIHE